MKKTQKKGFTLIELLTVIAIIGILAGILIPAVNRVRTSARQSVDTNNVRQIALAYQIYINENNERLPSIASTLPNDETLNDIDDVIQLLREEADLNDPSIWNSPNSDVLPIAFDDDGVSQGESDYAIVVGASGQSPSLGSFQGGSPMVWLRGLLDNGNWDEDAAYGERGGAIAYFGGQSEFTRRAEFPVVRSGVTGSTTRNFEEAIPTSAEALNNDISSGPE